MNQMAKTEFLGVDVGKHKLNVCLPNGQQYVKNNTKKDIKDILRDAKKLQCGIAFEATGPYCRCLYDSCIEAAVPAIQLDSLRTRKYAQARGCFEKNDTIDCEMIRDFAQSIPAEERRFIRPISKSGYALREASKTRDTLMKMMLRAQNQLESLEDPTLRKLILEEIKHLKKAIEKCDEACQRHIDADEEKKSLAARFQEVVGIGPRTTCVVLAQLPEIGTLSDRAIAKLVGLAPLECSSCTIKKPRHVGKGREDVRRVVYEAAIVGSQHNHIWKAHYQALVARGKPKKVAIIAIARKVVILLNHIAADPNFVIQKPPAKK